MHNFGRCSVAGGNIWVRWIRLDGCHIFFVFEAVAPLKGAFPRVVGKERGKVSQACHLTRW